MIHELLDAQYALVRSARGALLDYCATLAPADFVAPVPAFNNSSIRDLLVHVANVYLHWLVVEAQRQPRSYHDPAAATDVAAVRTIYAETDEVVAGYLGYVSGREQQPELLQVPRRPKPLSLTPLALFTHVTTHEFHHKGQVLSMSRQLGYTPVDTDVVRF
jgi:uncharacterized damage-inducible protein DinB